MKDTAPISQGIIAVAALFGIIAAGVAYVLYEYGLFGSLFIGLVVALIAAIVLALGWREPNSGPQDITDAPAAAPAPEPAPVPAAAPEPAAESDDGTPEFLSAAREGGPDDLKQIKGVGKKLEQTLHGMGIYHFDQIASWGPKEQAWMDDNLKGFKGRATRDEWVPQAKLLAAGGETEFSKKVDKGDVY